MNYLALVVRTISDLSGKGRIEMSIKDKIRDNPVGKYLISELHCLESWLLPILIDDETAVKKYYKSKTGKVLNLQNPVSFAEKLNWYKLNAKMPLMQQCADKVAVRDYVTQCGYANMLNEQYGVYDSVRKINWEALPKQFVIKAAHGSHMNVIVKDKNKICRIYTRMLMASWLRQNIYWSGREWVYKDMPRRLVVERYLEDDTGELRDFKFFCFNGKPEYLQFDSGRFKGCHVRNYYDADFNLTEITDSSTIHKDIGKPITELQFNEMKKIASKLSEPFQFVRVDFYVIKDKIYFGEMTFFDGGGYSGFSKEEYDMLFGSKWKIVK